MPCRTPLPLPCVAPRRVQAAYGWQAGTRVARALPFRCQSAWFPTLSVGGRASVAAGRLDVGRGGAGSGYLLGRGACMRRCTAMARRQRHVAVPVRGGRGGSDLAPRCPTSSLYLQLWSHGLVGAVREHTVPRQRRQRVVVARRLRECNYRFNKVLHLFTDVAEPHRKFLECAVTCVPGTVTPRRKKQDPTITACIEWIIQHEPRGRSRYPPRQYAVEVSRHAPLVSPRQNPRAQWCSGAQSTHPLEARLLEFHAAPVDLCRP